MKVVCAFLLFGAASAILPSEFLNVNPDSRIVGGSAASIEDFPYQVGLSLSTSSGSVNIFCGGSFINTGSSTKTTIVTAAHCVEGLSPNQQRNLLVYFGLEDRRYYTASDGVMALSVESITMHESYNSNTLVYDVAVIIINQTPQYISGNSKAAPITLASGGYNNNELGTVSGWGTTDYGGSTPTRMRYVTKPILTIAECKATSYDPSWILDSMMCCGVSGKDACQGDSGGPLITTRSQLPVLIGVVSWGYGCGFDGYPGVYADVYFLLNWINQNSAN